MLSELVNGNKLELTALCIVCPAMLLILAIAVLAHIVAALVRS